MWGALFALAAALLVSAPVSGAEVFGQLSSWGTPGTGAGQLDNPASCSVFGVDPVDGSVYVGDTAPSDSESCRIQKFSSTGTVIASTTLPVEESGTVTHPLRGMAIDHTHERFYLVEGNQTNVATKILVYSTAPSSGQLVEATTAFSLPSGAEALKRVEGIAVDPEDGHLVVIGKNLTEEHVTLLRVSKTGAIENRFEGTSKDISPNGRQARSVVIGKGGKTYTLTGSPSKEGQKFTRAWELPANLSSVKEVPGFAAASESEVWLRGLLNEPYSQRAGGAQLAISPSGDILFFKENLALSSPTEPGEVIVRGYSLSEEKTAVVYGGGAYKDGSGSCSIATSEAPIGATAGSHLVVFDHVDDSAETGETWGPPRVVTFGPGGTGCVPSASFSVNPAGSHVKGDLVNFNAEASDPAGNSILAYEWEFGDGTTLVVEGEEGEAPSPMVSHRFLATGEYTAKLKLELSNAAADPAPAEQKVTVEPASPVPSFEVLPGLNPAPGATVEFDASLSRDPAGGSCSQLTGCDPSFQMQSYEWDFGDGTKAGPSTSATVTHAFANPGSSPLQHTVTLTVETEDGVKGTTAEVITVQGTPDQGGGGEVPVTEPPTSTPPVTTPPPPPPVTKKAPPVAEKRAQARKKCKKLKGKAKSQCMKKANAIGKKKSRSSG